MNTTNTPVVNAFSSFFSSKEEYLSFKAHWKELAKSRSITAADAALRMLVLDQTVASVMPPTKNPTRIANGALYCSGARLALTRILYEARAADRVTPTDFSGRWGMHGITLKAMASLAEKATAALSEVR